MLKPLDPSTRQALDLDRLLALMGGRARTAHGREMVEGLCPVPREEAVLRSALVSECCQRLGDGGHLGLLPAADARPWLAHLAQGAVRLELEELRDAGQFLEASESQRLELSQLDPAGLARLRALGGRLPELDRSLDMFQRTFSPEGEIRDDATGELKRIRREIIRLDSDIQRRLERLLRNLEGALSEQYVTIRNDRYVFPVKAESHRKVPGLLHGQSGSGATYFIEPFEVVELNNQRNELKLEELAEVDRILKALTARLAGELGSLESAEELLAELDALEALGRSSRRWNGRAVHRPQEASVRLRHARHPLLLEQRVDTESVVPLELDLPAVGGGILITGPNMGGKTVVLKTVGLTVFLACCGAHVSAAEGSEVGDFESLWADIGDAQSLERDLSTFAGHLTRLDRILKEASGRTLVLCDELGTGTDPMEGAALSQAFLESLRGRGARVLATSHLGQLKLFASRDSGYTNASMEFESGTFQPTYRVRTGVPGHSHALEMAHRLGCLSDVLDRARELLGPGERDAGRLLEELARLAESQERALEENRASQARAEELAAELNRRVAQWEEERRKLRTATIGEAQRVLEEVEAWAADLKAAVRSQNRQAAREAREKLEQRIQELQGRQQESVAASKVVPGQRARLPRLRTVVEVQSAPGPDGRVWVLHLGVRLLVGAAELEPLEESQPRPTPVAGVELATDRMGASEVDLRGLSVTEAEERLERALDDAILTGLHELRIIHGKGLGVLRKRVQELLKVSPYVRAHRLGNWNEGGGGVTVADLDL